MQLLTVNKIRVISICFFVFFSIGIIGQAFATTYYVDDDTCPNSGTGTAVNPYCKIQSAANVVNPGDTVIVKDGHYTDLTQVSTWKEAVRISRSGSSNNYITFKAENKKGAVIDGSVSPLDSYGFNLGSNVSYVKIENFEIKNMGWNGVNVNSTNTYIIISNNYIHDIGRRCTDNVNGITGASVGKEASNVTFINNIFKAIGRLTPDEGCSTAQYWKSNDHGIYIRGDNVTINSNIFYGHFSGWPIQVYTGNVRTITGLTITDNTFKDPQVLPGHIILSNDLIDVTIQYNRFYNPATAAMNVSSWAYTNNVKVNNNVTTASSMATNNSTIVFNSNMLNASLPPCADGRDNDGDGKIDYGTEPINDPSCSSFQDETEANIAESDQIPPAPPMVLMIK